MKGFKAYAQSKNASAAAIETSATTATTDDADKSQQTRGVNTPPVQDGTKPPVQDGIKPPVQDGTKPPINENLDDDEKIAVENADNEPISFD